MLHVIKEARLLSVHITREEIARLGEPDVVTAGEQGDQSSDVST